MKKIVALFLSLALVLTLTVSALAEPVTITYAHFSGAGAQEETLKKMIAIFEEKNPDIKVDLQITGYDDYFTKLLHAAWCLCRSDRFGKRGKLLCRYAGGGLFRW